MNLFKIPIQKTGFKRFSVRKFWCFRVGYMEKFRLTRILSFFLTGVLRYHWFTKKLHMINIYNFLTTIHLTVNSVTYLSYWKLLMTRRCQFEYGIVSEHPQTSLRSSKTAEVSFSIVLVLIKDRYSPLIVLITFQHFSDIVIDYFIITPILQTLNNAHNNLWSGYYNFMDEETRM